MQDKQRQRSPEARLCIPRLSDWGPTPETLGGRAPEQRLAAPRTGPRWQTDQAWARLRPKAAERMAKRDWDPKLQTGLPHETQSQSGWSCRLPTRDLGPKQQKDWRCATQAQNHRSADQVWCLPGTTPKSTGSEQLLHSPCQQSPAGPTGFL